MSQHDYNIANGGGAAVRADINNALSAIQSQNSGSSAPTTTAPKMPWYDTANGALKFRDNADANWESAVHAVAGDGGMSFRNRIINGNFRINQRGYVSGAATTAGQYTLDRWKVTGTGGITFSTTANKTTITIPSGQTIQQVIEGLNLDTGTYVLSWEGTALGRVNSGSYGASGTVTASVTGGTNTTIEFNAGTVTNIQFEQGTTVTPFERRDYGRELIMCQRYYEAGTYSYSGGYANSSVVVSVHTPVYFKATKRATPTIGGTNGQGTFSSISIAVDSVALGRGNAVADRNNNGTFTASAEL